MDKKTVFLILALIVLVALGSIAGYFTGYRIAARTIENQELASGFKVLKSQLAQNVSAILTGSLKEIFDHNLVIEANGQSIAITLKDNVVVSEMVFEDPESAPVRQEKGLSDLRVGSELAVFVSLDSEGNLKGEQIDILALPQEQLPESSPE